MWLLKKIILILFLLNINVGVFAYNLDVNVKKYLRSIDSRVEVRFDGLITFRDGTQYVPLEPSAIEKVEKLKIIYTYPEKSTLRNRPQIVIFNNNFALLKLIKLKDGKYTLCRNENIPLTVKTGLLPQDLLVPAGFLVPDHLKGIMGDLVIPLASDIDIGKKYIIGRKNDVNMNKNLTGKLYLTTNFASDNIRVYDGKTGQPIYTLNLSGIPRTIVPIMNKYLLVLIRGKTQVDIVDLENEQIVRQIDLLNEPTGIVVDNNKNIAYISTNNEKCLYKVDVKNVILTDKITTEGVPTCITLSDDKKKIIYLEKDTSDIYCIFLDENNKISKLNSSENISKFILKNDILYTLSRSDNMLNVSRITSLPETYEEFKVNSLRVGKTIKEIEDEIKEKEKKEQLSNFTRKYNRSQYYIYRKASKKSNIDEPDPRNIRTQFLQNIEVSTKPVDMVYHNDKIYIICAKDNQLFVVDTITYDVNLIVKLPFEGFCNKITKVDGTGIALITNVKDKNYLIFDLESCKTLQKVPVDTFISDIVVIDKDLDERL